MACKKNRAIFLAEVLELQLIYSTMVDKLICLPAPDMTCAQKLRSIAHDLEQRAIALQRHAQSLRQLASSLEDPIEPSTLTSRCKVSKSAGQPRGK